MKVLFISGELIGAALACRLQEEGCDVRLYIEDESRKDCLHNIVKKSSDWKKELKWVGKNGLIVFDDVGYGKIQDELRAKGFLVVGGSEGGDRLEEDRQFAQKIFRSFGIDAPETISFKDASRAIAFVKKNPKRWVIKQDGHNSTLNYVGAMEDGSDALSVLERYGKADIHAISLQERIDGVEIGIARYFNGNDWVGPIEVNIEHKRLCNGDIGPMTGEMGTLAWYDHNEDNVLFQKTLAKIKPYLQKVNFRGDIDINCIVEKDKVSPIEVTARFGCPSTSLQIELHQSKWKDFLMAVAAGDTHNLRYKQGYGIVVSVAIPPYPYKVHAYDQYMKGVEIFFNRRLSEAEMDRIHFEEVSIKNTKGNKKYVIAGSNGYILYVTGYGKTVQKASEQAYSLINKIVIPKMFYRSDIGLKFIERDEILLKKWGYL